MITLDPVIEIIREDGTMLTLQEIEIKAIELAFARFRTFQEACAALSISRSALNLKIQKYGIERNDARYRDPRPLPKKPTKARSIVDREHEALLARRAKQRKAARLKNAT